MKYTIILSLLLVAFFTSAQTQKFEYQHSLSNSTEQWHKVYVPYEAFERVEPEMRQFRIYGVKETDTIEVPFLFKEKEGVKKHKVIPLQALNRSHNARGYYYTYEALSDELINEITLKFTFSNFDYRIQLEGSHNQKEWFTIRSHYRILSISNIYTDYKYTTIRFPQSNYKYYRVRIKTKKDPYVSGAAMYINTTEGEELTDKSFSIESITEDKENKRTIIKGSTNQHVPICRLKIHVKDTVDYYRNVSFSYFTDSVKTEKGWIQNYRKFYHSTLSSIDTLPFEFESVNAQRFEIVINNYDNPPLTIDSISAQSYKYELTGRFNGDANYILAYGFDRPRTPYYDIEHFKNKIPKELSELTVGNQVIKAKEEVEKVDPLLENEMWLWAILIVIILLLGFFTLRMMNKKDSTLQN